MFHSYTIVFAKVINVFIKKLFSIVAYCFLGKSFGVKVLLLGMQYIFSNFSC